MRRLKSELSTRLRQSPQVFDFVKRLSRLLGDRGAVYEFLNKWASTHRTCQFLQIGASDGIANDPIREFIIQNPGWSGVLVEPVPHVYEQLTNNYQPYRRGGLWFENVAVSNVPGILPFYTLRPESSAGEAVWKYQVGSFDRAHVLRQFSDSEASQVVEIAVQVATIETILLQYGLHALDLLVVDAEGHEPAILSSVPAWVRPKIVIFERTHLKDDRVCRQLASAGYAIREVGDEDAIALLA